MIALGIASFFQPFEARVTLSSDSMDPKFVKPHPSIFRAALDKIEPAMPFAHAFFITEQKDHVDAARNLGMAAAHVKGAHGTGAEVKDFVDVVPRIRKWLGV
jgi:FMN phosphatase YigB (HAD superfamily)